MKLIERLSTTEGLLQLFDRVLRWAPPVVGSIFTGLVTAVSAKLTETLQRYQPLSWVVSGLAGAVMFATAWFVWSKIRLNAVHYRYALPMAEKVDAINPLDTNFHKRRIDVRQFATPTNDAVGGKVFVECELRGPGVVVFLGNSILNQPNFNYCDFVKIDLKKKPHNAVIFVDVNIQGGQLCNLTVLVPDFMAKELPPGANWITPT